MTEGERVRLNVKSEDSVHGLQIKKFRVNTLTRRQTGDDRVRRLRAWHVRDRVPEECGDGHESMTGTLVVVAKPRPVSVCRPAIMALPGTGRVPMRRSGPFPAAAALMLCIAGCDESLQDFAGPTPNLGPLFRASSATSSMRPTSRAGPRARRVTIRRAQRRPVG